MLKVTRPMQFYPDDLMLEGLQQERYWPYFLLSCLRNASVGRTMELDGSLY